MKKIYSSLLLIFLFPLIHSQDKAFLFESSYIGDNVVNFSGGIKTGYAYLGMVNLQLGLDLEKSGLWSGGLLYVHAANTHGSTPSADMLGDIQTASNIEAGNHTYLQELWYRQTWGKIEITAGLQDLNIQFANTESGTLYLNSSLGILPVISGNIPAPIFPLTSLGLTLKWNINETTSWVNAIYDGSPTDFDYNPFNIRWKFASGDGILAITEFQYSIKIRELKGTYKLGMYSHNHIINKKDLADSLDYSISGIFFHADQRILDESGRSIRAFVQAGYSPSEKSLNKAYLGLGINFAGYLGKSKNDVLGLALAHGKFIDYIGSETTLELTWQKQIHKNIFIQPDIQYIINPSGRKSNLNNCLVGILRVHIAI